jgi:hypothetical protein
METVANTIGIMDPNSYSFRFSLEGLIRFLKPEINYGGKLHQISTTRIRCQAYDALAPTLDCKVVLNRGFHWNAQQESFLALMSRQIYLINNLHSFKSIIKNTAYGQMHELGLPIPPTYAIPQKDYTEMFKDGITKPELVFPEHDLFDLAEIGEKVGYPAFMKPQNGGGWVGVTKVENAAELQKAYNESGEKPMNLQKAIKYREFCRSVGVGPQIMPMHYNASAPHSHDRYIRGPEKAIEHVFLKPEEEKAVKQMCKIINAFYGWDHNSCEALVTEDSQIFLIDFANAYPDSKLVSLYYYFPELVKSMARWLIFCAVTEREITHGFGHDWNDYYRIMAQAKQENWPLPEVLAAYEALADRHFETAKFQAFCAEQMPNFDQQALEFFDSREFDEIIAGECQRYFTIAHEVPQKIDHYRGLIKYWIHCEGERIQG